MLTLARQSIEVQRSVIGHIASAIARVGDGEYESASCAFDFVFIDGPSDENKFLLLIKVCPYVLISPYAHFFCFVEAAILFECGRHEDAILRVDGLIEVVGDKSPYITVRVR